MALVHAFLGVEDIAPPTLEEEFNRTKGKHVPRPLARTARRLPGGRALARLVPRPVQRLVSIRLDTSLANISPGFEERLRDLLATTPAGSVPTLAAASTAGISRDR
jgi:hypothetical protein